MKIYIFIAMLFVLQFFYYLVGKKASKTIKNSSEDYFLAGKNVRFFPLMMTFLATQVGGGIILGSAEEAYHYGYLVILFPLGSALGLILLGSGVGRKLSKFSVSTVAEIFEKAYGSTFLRKIASILSVISLFMVLVAQIIASSKFLVSLGFNSSLLFIIFWGIVIIYTVQGGLKAVISTDIVQAIFFSFVFFLCMGFVIYQNHQFVCISIPKLETLSALSPKLTGWLLFPLLFMVIEQDMGQRCFAGATPRVVSKASFWSGIGTMAVCTIPVFFGTLAKDLNLKVPEGGSVLMTSIENLCNPYFAMFVGCAVLAAIISTATSLINAISSNLSFDFKWSFLRNKAPLTVARGLTASISIFAIFFAFYFNNIVDLLIQSYDLSVSCLFIPIFFALFKKRGNFISALLSIIFGALAFILFKIYPCHVAGEIAPLLFSFAGFGLGELTNTIVNKSLTAGVD